MDGRVADRRHGIDDDTDGVLLDGIDDAAIGGLPEVSTMQQSAGCQRCQTMLWPAAGRDQQRIRRAAMAMVWQSTMARGCLNKLNQVRQCILRAN